MFLSELYFRQCHKWYSPQLIMQRGNVTKSETYLNKLNHEFDALYAKNHLRRFKTLKLSLKANRKQTKLFL